MRLPMFAAVVSLVGVSSRLQAETHRVIPDRFLNTYSFAHPPALRIKPGDRVVTKAIGWPRLETETHVMILGGAQTLMGR